MLKANKKFSRPYIHFPKEYQLFYYREGEQTAELDTSIKIVHRIPEIGLAVITHCGNTSRDRSVRRDGHAILEVVSAKHNQYRGRSPLAQTTFFHWLSKCARETWGRTQPHQSDSGGRGRRWWKGRRRRGAEGDRRERCGEQSEVAGVLFPPSAVVSHQRSPNRQGVLTMTKRRYVNRGPGTGQRGSRALG